jgi:hypothetical protein
MVNAVGCPLDVLWLPPVIIVLVSLHACLGSTLAVSKVQTKLKTLVAQVDGMRSNKWV